MDSKTLTTLIAAGILICSLPGWAETLKIPADAIEVEDGDTLRVRFAEGVRRIQLSGIDAPEESENPKFHVDRKRTGLSHETLLSLGVISSWHLNRLIATGDAYTLRFDASAPDKYGRLPGELFSPDGASINALMVEEGYAIALPGEAPTLVALQQQAAREGKGLWGLLAKPTRLWAGEERTR